jgi:amino acid transporter
MAQSISGVAPTLAPFLTIPLVFTLSGNGTWLAFALAMVAILLVARCIGRFARYSASPGSLYCYASMILPPWLAATGAWSLLLAYVATSATNIGGFYHYTNVMLRNTTGHAAPVLLLATVGVGVPMWIAWRDVRISARLMLLIEVVSVTLILTVLLLVQARHGFHGDPDQVRLRGVTGSRLREGLVLALFGFVGFESATALGSEARNPLKTIPRAVILSSILTGTFFMICAFIEVFGFRMSGQDLGTSADPMHVLAAIGGVPAFGLLIDAGALVSMFAGTLACLTAAARVLLLMSHNGLTHGSLRETHTRNRTPGSAILATGLAAFLPVAVLAAIHTAGLDVYGWLGTLATYGFVVSYGLVCFALPCYLRDHHGVVNWATRTIPWLAFAAMVFALVGNLYPVPGGAYGKLPYIYLAYMAIAIGLFLFQARSRSFTEEEAS